MEEFKPTFGAAVEGFIPDEPWDFDEEVQKNFAGPAADNQGAGQLLGTMEITLQDLLNATEEDKQLIMSISPGTPPDHHSQ